MSKRWWSKGERAITIIIPALLALAALASILVYQNGKLAQFRTRAYQTMQDSAKEQAMTVRATLEGQYGALEALAGLLAVREDRGGGATRLELRAAGDASLFDALFVMDPQGRVSDAGAEALDASGQAYFQRARKGERALQSGDGAQADARFTLAVPIRDEGGVVGVLAGTLDERVLRDMMISEAYAGAGCSLVCGADGRILIGPEEDSGFSVGQSLIDELRGRSAMGEDALGSLADGLRAGALGHAQFTVDGEARYAVYQPLGIEDWRIVSVLPLAVLNAEIAQASRAGYVFVVLIAVLSVLIVLVVLLGAYRQRKRLEADREQMHSSEERFRVALENTTVTISEYDFATRQSKRTGSATRARMEENVPDSLVESGVIHPDSAEEYLAMYRALASGAKEASGLFRIRDDARGEYRYESIHYTTLFDSHGHPAHAIGVSEDVTERLERESRYRMQVQYQEALTADMCATALLNVTEERLEAVRFRLNQSNEVAEGMPLQEVFQAEAERVVEDEDIRLFLASLDRKRLEERFRSGQTNYGFDYLRRMISGETRWVREEGRLMEEPETGCLMLFLSLRDVDAERRRIDELTAAAECDAMTGLYHHDATFLHIQRYLDMEGSLGRHALFMIDIDNYKAVNDTLGHAKGDEVIRQFAGIIRGQFRGNDVIGRIGGDEFMVLMKNVASASLVRRRAQALVNALQFVCSSDGTFRQISASVGVSLYRGDHASLDALYKEADAALYRAKDRGKMRYVLANAADRPELPPIAPTDAPAAAPETSPLPDAGIVPLQALLEHMDGGVMLAEVGQEITIAYASPSLFKAMRRKRTDEFQTLWQVVCEEDRPEIERKLRFAAASGEIVDMIYRVLSETGGVEWRQLRAVRIPDEESRPMLIGVVTDVTQMRKSQIQFQAIAENAPYGVAIFEPGETLRVIFCNDRLLEITGLTREEYARRVAGDAYIVFRADDAPRVRETIARVMADGAPRTVEYRTNRALWGTECIMQAYGVRLEPDGDRPRLLVMFRDVTEERKLNEELRRAARRAES